MKDERDGAREATKERIASAFTGGGIGRGEEEAEAKAPRVRRRGGRKNKMAEVVAAAKWPV